VELLLDDVALFACRVGIDVFELDTGVLELALDGSRVRSVHRVTKRRPVLRELLPLLDDVAHQVSLIHNRCKLVFRVITGYDLHVRQIWCCWRPDFEIAERAFVDQLLRSGGGDQLLKVLPETFRVRRCAQTDKWNLVPLLHPLGVEVIENMHFIDKHKICVRQMSTPIKRSLRTHLHHRVRICHLMVGLNHTDVCDALLVE